MKSFASRFSRQDVLLLAGLLLAAALLPLLVSAFAGSIDIPRNDDWSYRRIALRLAATGELSLDGIASPMLVGMILVTQPLLWVFGPQGWVFGIAGEVFAVAGIVSAFLLARAFLPSRMAALSAGLLALTPGYLAYATSYMTDVPALAAQFLCLAAGVVALKSRPIAGRWLVASLIVGVFGFSIREIGLAAPACVALAVLCAEPRRLRSWALAAAVAVACVAIATFRYSLPGQLAPIGTGSLSPGASIYAASTVSLVVAPAALIGAIRWRKHLRRFDVQIGLGMGLGIVIARTVLWVTEGVMPVITLGNLASPSGTPGETVLIGGRPLLFGEPVWTIINVLALGATVLVLGLTTGIVGMHIRRCNGSWRTFISRLGTGLGAISLFCLVMTTALVVFGLTRALFDRYFWPLVPPLAVLLLYLPRDLAEPHRAVTRGWDRALGGAAVLTAVVLAAELAAYLLNSHAFDAARWRAGERLEDAGVPGDQIDAGFEWVGYHAPPQGDPTLGHEPGNLFYQSWWPSFSMCGFVSSRPISASEYSLIGTTEYQLNLVPGPTETLYLYRVETPACDGR